MEKILGWKTLHGGGVWETNFSLGVNGMGMKVTKAYQRGKPESPPYQNDGAVNQAEPSEAKWGNNIQVVHYRT